MNAPIGRILAQAQNADIILRGEKFSDNIISSAETVPALSEFVRVFSASSQNRRKHIDTRVVSL